MYGPRLRLLQLAVDLEPADGREDRVTVDVQQLHQLALAAPRNSPKTAPPPPPPPVSWMRSMWLTLEREDLFEALPVTPSIAFR
jgi:hypothetical protein